MNKYLQRQALINEINLTKLALECAYSKFENAIEPDIIDCTIYELNAAQTKYKFLLNKIKEIEEILS